jgi:hypothetical protein
MVAVDKYCDWRTVTAPDVGAPQRQQHRGLNVTERRIEIHGP